MGTISILRNVTSLALPAERVLANAPELESVVILGYKPDGEEYFASSISAGPEVLWLLKRLEAQLLGYVPQES
jgi:hypothetical protein